MRFVIALGALSLLSACAVPPPDPNAVNRATAGEVVTGSRLRTKTAQGVKTVDGRAAADQMRGTMESRPQGQ